MGASRTINQRYLRKTKASNGIMPGTVSDGPSVNMSFANNFWGKDDAGVDPLLQRMHNAKQTCDELKAFYTGMFISSFETAASNSQQHALRSRMITQESCCSCRASRWDHKRQEPCDHHWMCCVERLNRWAKLTRALLAK